jgi:hypothetical protein
VDKGGELWRRICEARYVLAHNSDWRQEFYKGVAKHRGEAAARQLVEDVKRERANLSHRQ